MTIKLNDFKMRKHRRDGGEIITNKKVILMKVLVIGLPLSLMLIGLLIPFRGKPPVGDPFPVKYVH